MFIQQTKTRNATTGEAYSTFRLVVSERVGKQVRQRTLLNLGRHFALEKDKWPLLCSRIESLLSGQKELVPQAAPAAIESLAQCLTDTNSGTWGFAANSIFGAFSA